MEKSELVEYIEKKMSKRDCEVLKDTDDDLIICGNMKLPTSKNKVHVKFEVDEGDLIHSVRWTIKYPVKLRGDIGSFYKVLNEINAGFTTGRYFLDGDDENCNFCSFYQTIYFKTDYESDNLDRNLMFIFDSLLLEYSEILKKVK